MLIFAVLFLTLFLIYKNIPFPIEQRRGLFLFRGLFSQYCYGGAFWSLTSVTWHHLIDYLDILDIKILVNLDILACWFQHRLCKTLLISGISHTWCFAWVLFSTIDFKWLNYRQWCNFLQISHTELHWDFYYSLFFLSLLSFLCFCVYLWAYHCHQMWKHLAHCFSVMPLLTPQPGILSAHL